LTQNNTLARDTGTVLIITVLSRLLGFVRDAVIAGEFGATGATDAYLIAYNLPYAVEAVLGMAFVTVIVPALTPHLAAGDEEGAWRLTSRAANWSTMVLALLAVTGMVFAPELVGLLAPGFSGELFELTVSLTRVMLPSLLFMGLALLCTGVLNARKIFAIPAAAPAVSNLVIIAAVFTLARELSIMGLAYGTLMGFAAMLLVQLPSLNKTGFRYAADFSIDSELKAIGRALGPVVLAVAVNQVYLMLNRFFASSLEPGSITVLDLASRVMNLPVILVAAIWTTTFPLLAEKAAGGDQTGFARTLSRAMKMGAFLIIPAALGLAVLAGPVVQLLFQRGAFDGGAAAATARALVYFCAGLPALSLGTLLGRAFYAQKDYRTPVVLGYLAVALDIALSLLLMPLLGYAGLALANSLAMTVNAVCLALVLNRRRLLPLGDLAPSYGRIALASALMLGVVLGGVKLGAAVPAAGFGALLVKTLLLAGLGALAYALFGRALGLEETGEIWDQFVTRIVKKR